MKQAAAVLIVGRGSACGRLQGCGRRAAAARSVCSPAAHTGAGEVRCVVTDLNQCCYKFDNGGTQSDGAGASFFLSLIKKTAAWAALVGCY